MSTVETERPRKLVPPWLDAAALFAKDRNRRREVLERGLQSPAHAAFVARLARGRAKRRRQ
jgi:hypothetical protein